MRYKSRRLNKEYLELPDIGKLILDYVDYFSQKEFGIEIMITHLFRTQDEQDYIYKGRTRKQGDTLRHYGKNPWYSDHQFWQAADIRTFHYKPEQVKKIIKFINENFRYNKDDSKKMVLYHQIGSHGWHFHIRWCKETICLDSYNPYIF